MAPHRGVEVLGARALQQRGSPRGTSRPARGRRSPARGRVAVASCGRGSARARRRPWPSKPRSSQARRSGARRIDARRDGRQLVRALGRGRRRARARCGRASRHPQRGEVGHEVDVAVAELPAGELVAGHRLHLHVDGEQVVAAVRAVGGDVARRRSPASKRLPTEPAVVVGEPDDHGVDLARRRRARRAPRGTACRAAGPTSPHATKPRNQAVSRGRDGCERPRGLLAPRRPATAPRPRPIPRRRQPWRGARLTARETRASFRSVRRAPSLLRRFSLGGLAAPPPPAWDPTSVCARPSCVVPATGSVRGRRRVAKPNAGDS